MRPLGRKSGHGLILITSLNGWLIIEGELIAVHRKYVQRIVEPRAQGSEKRERTKRQSNIM